MYYELCVMECLWPWLPALLTIMVIRLMFVAYRIDLAHSEEREMARLLATAEHKVQEVDRWYNERLNDAAFISGRHILGGLISTWREKGDPASWNEVRDRLKDYQTISGYHSVLLLDASGHPIGGLGGNNSGSDNSPPVAPALQAAAQRAIAENRPVCSDLYLEGTSDEPKPTPFLDFVAPLSLGENETTIAVALRVRADQFLYPYLQSWPVPSASGETLLFRRDGDDVMTCAFIRGGIDLSLAPLDAQPLGRSHLAR